jgi:lipopolysaccharide/colanic/teichoic acid biosynthesis glycosyltransferase
VFSSLSPKATLLKTRFLIENLVGSRKLLADSTESQQAKPSSICDGIEACHSVEAELSPKSLLTVTRTATLNKSESMPCRPHADDVALEKRISGGGATIDTSASIHLVRHRLSPWTRSGAKRLFDCACILPFTPLLVPLFLAVGLAVRLTSAGPVLFLQKRIGRGGRIFTIVKFRTLTHCSETVHQAVTTAANQRFTPVGPFLRRWKLDELPQLWNVLTGDMSLVGARPKLPKHQIGELECRPGITGAATIAFACEEAVLARLPERDLDDYYNEVILPLKHGMDEEYMARATFASDFKLLVNTVLRRWDSSLMESLLSGAQLDDAATPPRTVVTRGRMAIIAGDRELTPEEQLTEA